MTLKSKSSRSSAKQRILLVDDHPIMRQGLVQLIENEKDLKVVGEADNAADAMALIPRIKPNLVLTDITMPGKNGVEFIKDLKAIHPEIEILVLSMHDESLYAERVLKAGGRGYVMKHEGGKNLISAIRKVLNGQIFVSEKMASKILEVFSGHRPTTKTSPIEGLTDREFEIFQWLGKGLSTREIADQLHLSVKTVEVHRVNIKAKLKIKTASELIRHAVRWVESQETSVT